MVTCISANAWGATVNSSGCANPEDISAVRAAAVQQRLMVAAFSCQAIDRYNKFVITYRNDLQASDLALQRFFRRLYGQTGTADYHAFKTRLANTSSIDSIHDVRGYCANAEATFDAALSDRKKSLTIFLAGQPTEADRAFAPCQVRTANESQPPGER
jgi:hypothetical protein